MIFSSLKMNDQLSLKALHIILVGEHLRSRLHSEQEPPMIRDRRYHLRMYPCCFIGRDVVDWLMKNSDANSRAGAVQCMDILLENGVIHHGRSKKKGASVRSSAPAHDELIIKG